LLIETYSEDCTSRPHVFEWNQQFSEGGESVKDCDPSGRSSTSVTANNNEKMQGVV
jgi:hypothetical protein